MLNDRKASTCPVLRPEWSRRERRKESTKIEVTRCPTVIREGVAAQKVPELWVMCMRHRALGDCPKNKLSATFGPKRLGANLDINSVLKVAVFILGWRITR